MLFGGKRRSGLRDRSLSKRPLHFLEKSLHVFTPLDPYCFQWGIFIPAILRVEKEQGVGEVVIPPWWISSRRQRDPGKSNDGLREITALGFLYRRHRW